MVCGCRRAWVGACVRVRVVVLLVFVVVVVDVVVVVVVVRTDDLTRMFVHTRQ